MTPLVRRQPSRQDYHTWGGAFARPAWTVRVAVSLHRRVLITPMKSLAVRVLGDFGVDGIEPQALGSRKARLALQLIALAEGQVVPADVLIDALWDETPPARPDDRLAVLMSRLRSVLGRDRIEHRD